MGRNPVDYLDLSQGGEDPQELGHNPYNLPSKALVKIRQPSLAQKAIRSLMDQKRPRGMRLRYGPVSSDGKTWLLESTKFEAVRIAKKRLEEL